MNYLWIDVDDDTAGGGSEANPLNYTQFGAYLSGDVVVGLSAEPGDIYYIKGNRFLTTDFSYFYLAENSFSATSWNDDGNPWGINRYPGDGNNVGFQTASVLSGTQSKVFKDAIFYRTNVINSTSAAITTVEFKNCVFGDSLIPFGTGGVTVGTSASNIFNGCSFVDTYIKINQSAPA